MEREKNFFIGSVVAFCIVLVVAIVIIILIVTLTNSKNTKSVKEWCLGDLQCNIGGDQKYDIVIVGAGVSGLFCAARIKQFYPEKTILILEQGNHIGGRLESIPLDSDSNANRNYPLFAEAGGMRYFPRVDEYTDQLIKDLKIETVEIEYVAPENLTYLRGVRMRIQDLPQRSQDIFNLAENEKGLSSQDIVSRAVQDTLREEGISLDEISTNKRLLNTTFKNMLAEKMTFEAIQYFEYTNGYNFSLDDVSAATAIDENKSILPNQASPQMFVKNGYEDLPLVLAKKLKGKVEIRMQQQVEKFSMTKGGNISVLVQPVKPKDIQTVILSESERDGSSYIVTAKKLLLCIPRAEMLPLYEWPASVLQDVGNVIPWEGTKIFLQFKNAWWKKYGLSRGRSVTDIPMRQVWYWNNNPPVLMIYCDNLDALYWRSLMPKQVYPEWKDPSDAPALVKEAKRQLSIMYDVNEEELQVVKILWRFWPFGNYFWKPTDKKMEIQKRMIQPLGTDFNVFVASDCWSNYQSWVNGALENSDVMLKRLNIPSLMEKPLEIK